MKKYIVLGVLSLCLFTNSALASVEDTSIIDILNKNSSPSSANFKLQTFNSCDDMSNVMGDYIKTYWENSSNGYWGGWLGDGMIMEDMGLVGGVTTTSPTVNQVKKESVSDPETGGSFEGIDYSETNIQVAGVDESDIIKTDGNYVYYYNSGENYIYIVSLKDRSVVKKIKVPDSFYSPVMYLANNKLTILSSGDINYSYDYNDYWLNRNQKTYVIIYDVSNVSSPKLDKLYVVDGGMQESRRIGDYIYVISNTSFNIPYYNYKTFEQADFSVSKIMPQKIEVSVNGDKGIMNSGNVADCNNISYVLPDEDTIKQFGFSPSFNIVSVIDIKNTNNKVNTNVIAGSNSEVYMSLDNLYLTSYMYQNASVKCPLGARCVAPTIQKGTNTLIHKMNIDGPSLKYQNSTLIPGMPLTQYSMDEYKENFRILTQTNNWSGRTNETYVDLYILDKDLNLKGSLTKLGKGEQFKSSRYIGEKLFLVTFEQVDPLFVIDVANPASPKVLGELKIPGYSTYLHPYDENHLIGIGYDTTENKYGSIMNAGVKVDLYQINYNKKCSDSNLTEEESTKCASGEYKGIIAKQLYSKTLGGYGSSSEAQFNPRMFMWNKKENKLFLPVTEYETAEDDMYTRTNFFQGLATLTIDKDSGIKEDYKVTHVDYGDLEKTRLEECSKYTKENTTPTCVKLVNGEEYCQESKYIYVPKYCYANAGIGEYFATISWNYYDEFIKRALWVGQEVYAISDSRFSAHSMNDGKEIYRLDMLKTEK